MSEATKRVLPTGEEREGILRSGFVPGWLTEGIAEEQLVERDATKKLAEAKAEVSEVKAELAKVRSENLAKARAAKVSKPKAKVAKK